jgi:hypothetical protein
VTDYDLTIALAGLSIDFPEVPDLDFAFVERRPTPVVARKLRWGIAVAAAVVMAVVAFVAPVREAVADWFGIGVVHIVEVGEVPRGLSDTLDLGEAIPISSVRMAWPDSLDRPAGAFVGATEVSLVWLPGADLPEVGTSGVGALLTRFEGSLEAPIIEKTVGEGSTVVSVTIDGSPGYWIGGEPHTFGYLDDRGEIAFGTIRLAGNTLLWEVGGVTYRFESALEMTDAVRLMESIR